MARCQHQCWWVTSYWTTHVLTPGSIATADGSALVRMGDTTMVCGVKAEIAEPTSSTPNEGFVGAYLGGCTVWMEDGFILELKSRK